MDHQRPGLRDALAQAILAAKKSAQAETNRWKERCAQAERQADALRNEVLEELRRPPSAGDMDVLDAVVERNGGVVGDTTAFWRSVRIVQTVRERAGGAGAEAAGATSAPADVIAFLVDVVASAPAAEPPRHAAAFLDSAFKYLRSVPTSGNGGQTSAIQDACDAVAGVIAAHGPGAARDPRPCACAVLCRLAKQAHVLTAAVLMAVEIRLLSCVEACAAAASAAASAPFDEAPTWDTTAVHQHYENAYFLFSVAETALDVIAGKLVLSASSAQQGGLSPAEATATLERFARVHAKCQRCAEGLCPRFAVLASAIWRLTSAANAIALRVLQQE